MNCYGTNPAHARQAAQPAAASLRAVPPLNAAESTTGSPWGQSVPANPSAPSSPASVLPAPAEQLPPTLTETIYTPGYLRLHIGNLMRVEFLIGNATTDRIGYLKSVGASYIVLGALDGGSEVMCDIYSIKFITIIESPTNSQLYSAFQ